MIGSPVLTDDLLLLVGTSTDGATRKSPTAVADVASALSNDSADDSASNRNVVVSSDEGQVECGNVEGGGDTAQVDAAYPPPVPFKVAETATVVDDDMFATKPDVMAAVVVSARTLLPMGSVAGPAISNLPSCSCCWIGTWLTGTALDQQTVVKHTNAKVIGLAGDMSRFPPGIRITVFQLPAPVFLSIISISIGKTLTNQLAVNVPEKKKRKEKPNRFSSFLNNTYLVQRESPRQLEQLLLLSFNSDCYLSTLRLARKEPIVKGPSRAR